MDLYLKGKAVGITGGSSGIGLAAALEFAREGARVAICGRDEGKLAAAKAAFAAEGLAVETFRADVSRREDTEAFAAFTAETLGGIDVWINNAGGAVRKKMLDYTEEDWSNIVAVNLKSVFDGCRAAAPYLQSRGGGVILNTSSFAARFAQVGHGLYAACKSAVVSMTRSFAAELAPYGIRVLSIIPGFIETPLTASRVQTSREAFTASVALQRLGVPEDLAGPMVFLASPRASYMTGVSVEISGGKLCVQNPAEAWKGL